MPRGNAAFYGIEGGSGEWKRPLGTQIRPTVPLRGVQGNFGGESMRIPWPKVRVVCSNSVSNSLEQKGIMTTWSVVNSVLGKNEIGRDVLMNRRAR